MKFILISFGLILAIGCAKSGYIYRSPNQIDFVRIVKAKKSDRKEGFLHPYKMDPAGIRAALRSLHFNRELLIREDIQGRGLFEERHVELLAPYIIRAFEKAGPEELVVVSFFTQSRSFGLMNDRLTLFQAFMKEDGLHLRFSKLYAKLLGDRTTQGSYRAIQGAKGIRIGLETGPGQSRIGFDPEEIAIDLKRITGRSKEERPKEPKSATLQGPTTRQRLNELERLKEEGLITEEEYEKKRKKILKEL